MRTGAASVERTRRPSDVIIRLTSYSHNDSSWLMEIWQLATCCHGLWLQCASNNRKCISLTNLSIMTTDSSNHILLSTNYNSSSIVTSWHVLNKLGFSNVLLTPNNTLSINNDSACGTVFSILTYSKNIPNAAQILTFPDFPSDLQ